MLTIQISDSNRDFENIRDIDESWINQQINRRRQAGVPICVRVLIKTTNVDVALTSAGCAGFAGGNRPPREDESRVFELWEKAGLRRPEFQGGNLIAFLKQLRKIIG